VCVVARVGDLTALREAVERRLREVEVAVFHEARHLLEEEGHQQRGDVGAVDIGVGHDDDAVVTERIGVEAVARAAAERLDEIGDFLIGADLVPVRRSDVQDLAANGQDRLRLAVARLLGRAARRVSLDDENLGAIGCVRRTIGELAGEAQTAAARCGLALDLLFGAALQPLVHAFEREAE